MRQRLLFALMCVCIVPACTWVQPDSAGALVNVVYTPVEVKNCRPLGEVAVSVKSEFAGISRNEVKVRDELESLARNQAATMGADTVLPKSDVIDGGQEFFVYRCAA